ncbi:hypothetical protein [Natronohydrobacter thiooxidans]|uniref:hypothetical protein n=1 Tax=Natronohydrobacter thiooxidans TaxID=87172 RepID=UPI0008FF4AB2|nr:hypothetical protein [Natronohydrobacter thiooxidans]
MNAFLKLKDFGEDQSGAVTVDFVVLTAAICTLGAAIVLTVITGAQHVGDSTSESLSSAELAPIGPL